MNRRAHFLGGYLVAVLTLVASGARAQSDAVKHDTSAPLKDLLFKRPRTRGPDRNLARQFPKGIAERSRARSDGVDLLRQLDATPAPGAQVTPLPNLSFEGVSDADNEAVAGGRVVPPDTQGDVGLNYYVQWVNLSFAIYDKATGARILGPAAGNALWSGFGGICEQNNDGDPIVLYDHLADRWVFSQFAIGADGHQCFAVSATSDPTGAYHRYDFVVSPGAFNDYPKIGVWPDAYYLTANEFGDAGFTGAIAVAVEREAMLAGQPARSVKFGPLECGTECFFSLQPAHLEGPEPPLGTPNTFVMAFDDETWGTGSNSDGYRLWQFEANFAANVFSFAPMGQVDTTEFDAELCRFNPCIRQPRPGERLDALSAFTMYRAQYRQFPQYASIVLNHTVDVGRDVAGIRWVELRNEGAGWTVHQSGTYAPADGDSRWMGSIAMDGSANIALGFSVSGRRTFPSIRYVTRTPADPLGQMSGGEVEMFTGTGAQTRSFGRWGDYSSMSVDPVDDCTFWYTQEYYAQDGSFDFRTRIGNFTLPGCIGGGG